MAKTANRRRKLSPQIVDANHRRKPSTRIVPRVVAYRTFSAYDPGFVTFISSAIWLSSGWVMMT